MSLHPALLTSADTPGYLGAPQAGSQRALRIDSSSLREKYLLLHYDVFRAQDTNLGSGGVITFSWVASKCCQYFHNIVLQMALLARVLPHFGFGNSELHSPEMLMGF